MNLKIGQASRRDGGLPQQGGIVVLGEINHDEADVPLRRPGEPIQPVRRPRRYRLDGEQVAEQVVVGVRRVTWASDLDVATAWRRRQPRRTCPSVAPMVSESSQYAKAIRIWPAAQFTGGAS
jgi:hypothetical protein